jgi:DNA ligase (NAD+)
MSKTRIEQLRKDIDTYNHAYYVLGKPTISDAEFDKLFDELVALEKAHPELDDPASPTKRVGSDLSNDFAKVRHNTPMLSLEKATKPEQVTAYFGMDDQTTTDELMLEPKIDGASLSLHYHKGHLVKAVTRGDGDTGDDVTENAKTIRSIPLYFEWPYEEVEVRGEVFMRRSRFQELNKELEAEGEELLANPRNAAAAKLKLKNPKECAQAGLDFCAYYIQTGMEDDHHYSNMLFCLSQHFISPKNIPLAAGGMADCVRKVHWIEVEDGKLPAVISELDRLRGTLDVDTDGLVIKLASLERHRSLGYGTRTPKWAMAYKFPPEQKVTTLKEIFVTVGKSGKLTPVAVLEPVKLAGTTVTQASLCNQDEVDRLGIGIGDKVIVLKSNEIIPKVVGRQASLEEAMNQPRTTQVWKMPTNCPCCDLPVERPEGMVDYYCTNSFCTEKVKARLILAMGKGALDMDGCGKEMAAALVDQGKVNYLSDVWNIDAKFLKPAAKKSLAAGLKAAIQQPMWRQLRALGIDGIGTTLCKDIQAKYMSLDAMLDDDPANVEKLLGKVNTERLIDWLDNEGGLPELLRLKAVGFTFAKQETAAGPLTGKTFVITGALVTGKRHEVSAKIEAAGGTVKGSVGRKVNYLVMGTGEGETKKAAAAKLGVQVISEEQLYEMMGVPFPKVTDADLADVEY